MAEINTAGNAGTGGEPAGNTGNSGNNNSGAGAGATFTQADVDRIIESRLAAERSRQPNDDELRAYREWKKTQKTEAEKQAERAAALASAQSELAQLKAQTKITAAQGKAEFAKFVTAQLLAMEGDFDANLKKYKTEHPQYFGETTIRRTSPSANMSGGSAGAGSTTNQVMNDLLRNRGH